MSFSLGQIDSLRLLADTRRVVKVEGANHLGQLFETTGIILSDRNAKGAYKTITDSYFLLFLGQSDEVTKKKKYMPVFTDMQNPRGMCAYRISDMSGFVVYENDNFKAMYEDRLWELNKFYGFQESRIEDTRGKMLKLVGKPVIIKGEKLALVSVGQYEGNSERVYLCCTNGKEIKYFQVAEHKLALDISAKRLIASFGAGENPSPVIGWN